MTTARILPLGFISPGRARRLVERHVYAYRKSWWFIVSGFFEPFFYLLSIGLGLNHLVGNLDLAGRSVVYAKYVAPGLLASSAMNGATIDATFQTFFMLKIAKTFDAMLASPIRVRDVAVGQIAWSVLRGSLYSFAFLCVMAALGLVVSPWAVLCFPAAVLIGFTFAALGVGLTCYMRSWQDFDLVLLAIMPLFLFSAVFYPLTIYPGWLQAVVTYTPLYQGVVLLRDLDAGALSFVLLAHVAYLLALGSAGFALADRRLERLLVR